MYYTTEDFALEHSEGIRLTYHGHNYALYGEWEGKISRYMLDDETEPYSIEVWAECDAKQIEKDNYVTVCWKAESNNPDEWIQNKIQNKKWNDNIVGVLPIDPPMDWEDLSSDEVDEIIRNKSREGERIMKEYDYVYKETGEFAMTEKEYCESVMRELKNNWDDCMSEDEKEEYASFEDYVSQEFDSWCASDDMFTTYSDWKTKKEYRDEWQREYGDEI